jgi:predicted Zn finger-like uncharacterized protein
MILECPNCTKKMKLDESAFPPGERIKIRCPHCSQISSVMDGVIRTDGPEPAPTQIEEIPTELQETSASCPEDPVFPRDAFKDFRFPAEQKGETVNGRSRTFKGILPWFAIGIGIILFFALLVNIILPGPYGGPTAIDESQKSQAEQLK